MPLPVNNDSPPIVVSFENVNFSYPQTPVLQNVSFHIHAGECVGIIGPNGRGKTTLLKLLLGFLQPQGVIRVFGKISEGTPLSGLPIAYVPQSIGFDKQFPISVEEVVLMGLLSQLPWYGKFSSAQKKKAKEILEKMDLAHLSNCPFGALSGGQAQRVLIARALVAEPLLLLLDEPTASIDREAEGQIFSTLRQLKGKVTILMVTHDLHVAIEEVDRVLCVQEKVVSLDPGQVCEHLGIGLYHKPLLQPIPPAS